MISTKGIGACLMQGCSVRWCRNIAQLWPETWPSYAHKAIYSNTTLGGPGLSHAERPASGLSMPQHTSTCLLCASGTQASMLQQVSMELHQPVDLPRAQLAPRRTCSSWRCCIAHLTRCWPCTGTARFVGSALLPTYSRAALRQRTLAPGAGKQK